jgi:hypothetical protein
MEIHFNYDGSVMSFDDGLGRKGMFPFHVPEVKDHLEDNDYDFSFLCSNYFVTEDDYYKVNLKGSDGNKHTLGWLFPSNLLKEDALFYKDFDDYLIKYMHVGVHKLIDYSVKNSLWKYHTGTIEDLGFSQDLILFVYRKSVCKRDRFLDLVPSLFDMGFHVVEKPESIDLSRFPINTYREEKIKQFKADPAVTCISLQNVSPVFSGSKYVETLFNETLVELKDPLLKYFSLYQIVEILMRVVYGNRYYEYVEKCANDNRHNLMDRFSELSSESKMIKKIYEIGTGGPEYLDFVDAAKKLLKKIDDETLKVGAAFDDYMYKIRNLIVHDLRTMRDYEKEMEYLSFMYESLIVDLMCRTNLRKEENKLIYVIDKTKSRKANVRAMKKTMDEKGIK